MKELIYDGWIKDGKLVIQNHSQMMNEIELMQDSSIEIIIRKKVKRRSFQQNAYYWGVVIPTIQSAIREMGERLTLNQTENWIVDFLSAVDKDFTHLFLKQKFIEKFQVDEETGEVIENKISTKRLDKDQFSEYLERVIHFANTILEIEIPEANY